MFIIILHWFVSALSLLLTAYLVPGFKVASFSAALWAAMIIGLANIMIRPVLLLLTLPINILTFGLFTFVVNAIVLKICAAFVTGFDIQSWGSAICGAVILAIVGTLLHALLI